MADIFCYVAHKAGISHGVCSPLVGKRELNKFLAEFATDGYTLTPMMTREEFMKFTEHTPMR